MWELTTHSKLTALFKAAVFRLGRRKVVIAVVRKGLGVGRRNHPPLLGRPQPSAVLASQKDVYGVDKAGQLPIECGWSAERRCI